MDIIFMGTPDFAVPILQTLIDYHRVTAVVTQPDRPQGRKQALLHTPVKILASAHGIPVLQPEKARDKAFRIELSRIPADVFVVAAYGQILSTRMLNIPPLGCLNVHASLLPRYRGASPIQYALLNGDTETGITIMYMDKGIDTGDILLQKTLPITPTTRFETLTSQLGALGSICIIEALEQIQAGTAKRVPQDHSAAYHVPMITKEMGHIAWDKPTAHILNLIRALDPWPGTYFYYDGQAIKIWGGEFLPIQPTEENFLPGSILAASPEQGFIIKTADGALKVLEVQAQGGRRMKAADYLRGHNLPPGTVLR